MAENMVSIPIGFVAIPLQDRDNLVIANRDLLAQIDEYDKKINRLIDLCKYEKDYVNVKKIQNIFELDIDEEVADG